MAHKPGVLPILHFIVDVGVWMVRRGWRDAAGVYFWACAPLVRWLASQR